MPLVRRALLLATAFVFAADARAASDRIASRGYVTWIYPQPDTGTRALGYVRNGSSVHLRSATPVAGPGCSRGFLAIEPRGFVCDDHTITRDPSPRWEETSRAARGGPGPLPFGYAFSDGSPMYNRIPTPAEQARFEMGYGPRGADRAPFSRAAVYHDLASLSPIAPMDAVPAFLAGGGMAAESRLGLVKESLPAGSILSFTKAFEVDGRTFLLSADQALVPADRVRVFQPSTFHGVALGGAASLPLAWVRGSEKPRYLEREGAMHADGSFARRAALSLTGGSIERSGKRFLETSARDAAGARVFVAADDATVVEAATSLPTGVKADQKWIQVSITRGTLVAYEGLHPVFATLISAGRGGIPVPGRDNVEDSTTPLGAYAITFKNRAATMSPDTAGGPRRSYISDVPFVQYFKPPFAIHGAFWHDRFGEPASAGCVNASPSDAEWLFSWTDPPVPDEWQGAAGAGAPANGKTTIVVVTR